MYENIQIKKKKPCSLLHIFHPGECAGADSWYDVKSPLGLSCVARAQSMDVGTVFWRILWTKKKR
jgi:hypothetical protein